MDSELSMKDSSVIISARTSLIFSNLELKIAEYTSILRASIIGIINPSEMDNCEAKTCKVSIAISGISNAKHKPFAAETPMRKPV